LIRFMKIMRWGKTRNNARSQSGWFVWWANIRIVKSKKSTGWALGFNLSLKMICGWWIGRIIDGSPEMFRRSYKYFDISLDLIYGVPGWAMKSGSSIEKALSFAYRISRVALTVEPKTESKMIQTGKWRRQKTT
jgi:hypothetical protein